MKKIKQIITVILISLLLFGRIGGFHVVLAEDAPQETTVVATEIAPSSSSTPVQPSTPVSPDAPVAPEAPKAPETSSSLVIPEKPKAPDAPVAPEAPKAPEQPKSPDIPSKINEAKQQYQNNSPSGSSGSTRYGSSASGNVGNSAVNTGGATNDASIVNSGNNNLSAAGACCGGTSASVINSGNGAYSDNSGSIDNTSNNSTNQSNSAAIGNNLNQSTVTGQNDSSWNVGDSSITTGDANTSGTIITSVNTNVDGVAVAEFNIADDHVGDIILDFGANCIAGCGGSSITAENSGNGAFSYNNADVNSTTNNTTNQSNDANVNNGMNLSADSGNNDASFNTGGDSDIITGDANVSANAITFANNNLAGNVIYGVVNIFGNLVGDIILTQEMLDAICGGTCSGSSNVANSGNGAYSDNSAMASDTTDNNIFQNNDATITNTLILDAQTGGNDTNFNTDGNSSITTGNANIDANILNVANLNIVGGTWWLVIVNEGGNWVGKILGGSGDGNFAGSPLLEFIINPITGGVTATNSENGVGSDNLTSINNNTTNTVNQTNNAVVNNELNLSANTGGNTSNFNTGGSSNITTGDANIVANIVNFVNNNITGNGKLVVTVINVFGSWLGDFVTPGTEKQSQSPQVSGGSSNQVAQSDGSSSSGSSNSVAVQSAQGTIALSKKPVGTLGNIGFGFFSGGSGNVSSQNSIQNKILGTNTNTLGAQTQQEKLSINLAAIVFVLPLVAFALILKSRLARIRIGRVGNV